MIAQALSELPAVHYKTGYRHQLVRDHVQPTGIVPVAPGGNDFVQLTVDGLLLVRAGYAWDGASWPAINTRSFVRPSLVHDAFYQLLRLGVVAREDRPAIDALLGQMLRADSLIIARRLPWHLRYPATALAMVRPVWVEAAVRLGGGVVLALHKDATLVAP